LILGHFEVIMSSVKKTIHDNIVPSGRLRVTHVASRHGQPISARDTSAAAALRSAGVDLDKVFKNLIVNVGRGRLARLLGGASQSSINRIQLGDVLVSGLVRKDLYPADLSDVSLVHEIRNLSGNPGATFDLDSTTYPDEIVKVNSLGITGTLVAGAVSLLTDVGQDFVAAGVSDSDTVTVVISGESYTLGVRNVVNGTQLELDNPAQLAAAVAYTVQTPGTQVLFSKLVNGDNFPVGEFGPVTIVHEAGLLFSDGALFNRTTFQQQDNSLGIIFQPTDIDGTRIDVQFDWLITF
jgi:hypothetical protein